MYLNKAIIIGNLTRDPELKAIPSGIKVATFGVATNRVWKDKDQQKQEATEYHNIVVFGRQAETVSQYMKKGNSILIEGRIQTRSWDADGQKKYRTEIVADTIQFGPKGSTYDGGSSASKPSESKKGEDKKQDDNIDTINYPDDEINPEDIPF